MMFIISGGIMSNSNNVNWICNLYDMIMMYVLEFLTGAAEDSEQQGLYRKARERHILASQIAKQREKYNDNDSIADTPTADAENKMMSNTKHEVFIPNSGKWIVDLSMSSRDSLNSESLNIEWYTQNRYCIIARAKMDYMIETDKFNDNVNDTDHSNIVCSYPDPGISDFC